MKKQILTIGIAILFAIGSTTFISCGNQQNNESESHEHTESEEHHEDMEHDHSSHEHGSTEENRSVSANMGEMKGDLSVVLSNYFAINESLVKDDASSAAKVSEKLMISLKEFKGSGLSEDEQKEVDEILESAIENAEHISENASKISHQREHLVSLSTDVKDLIALIGTSQKLYEDFCPMANDGKGAIWISETKEIQNPYMGTKMPTCGKIQKEW